VLGLFIFYSELDSAQLDSVELLDLVLLKVSQAKTYSLPFLASKGANNQPESIWRLISGANSMFIGLIDLLLVQIFKVIALY